MIEGTMNTVVYIIIIIIIIIIIGKTEGCNSEFPSTKIYPITLFLSPWA